MRPCEYEWVMIGYYDGEKLLSDTYVDYNAIVWIKVVNPEYDCEVRDG